MKVPHTLCPQTFSVYCPAPSPRPRDVITASDPDWDSRSPPLLERIVVRALARNLEAWCPWLLQALGPEHLGMVLEELGLDLPLPFCVRHVPDGHYWQRRALATWPGPEHEVCDVASHGGSWRRLVLERHVEGLLQRATPRLELDAALRAALREAAPHVRRVRLRELQAGPVQGAERDQLEQGHLQLAPVLALLPALQELWVRSGPREGSRHFSWQLFTLGRADASSLARGLASCPGIVSLRVYASHVTDETLAMLLQPSPEDHTEEEGEVESRPRTPFLSRLSHLDVSHNELRHGEVLAALVQSRPALTHLRLVNNKIGPRGAETLSASLPSGGLLELDLSLNPVLDAGGLALARHCGRLLELRLAGCGLGLTAARALAGALATSSLKSLDLSNNPLTEKAGSIFRDSLLKEKVSLKEIDLRMTEITEDVRQLINEILRGLVVNN